MIEALSQEAERAEIRERFANDAAVSESEAMESGNREHARGACPDNDSSAC